MRQLKKHASQFLTNPKVSRTMLAKLKTRENIWIRKSSGIWWTFSCLIQDMFLGERGGDCLYNILITYKFVITSYILHHIMSLLVIFFIHLINCSSFIFPTKSPSLIFEQIFSGWFTCPTANGACQACQNILRPIPIYSFSPPQCNCAVVLAVREIK